ncbi:MAG: Ribosomal RNA small subunit methyltransferase I [Chlamydiia bacterium]|nr:Ribosomal RNA small subunit methyltransferase I [Chlamydiia bacterium]
MLYIFPNLLDKEQESDEFLPMNLEAYVSKIDALVAESEKNARSFLKRFSYSDERSFRDIPIKLLNEHTNDEDFSELSDLLHKDKKVGLISDAGLACMADPGAKLVKAARDQNISVKTFSGPSSIIFALIYSGLNTQEFTFNGYLPRKDPELYHKLKAIDKDLQSSNHTHIFIEAPYRNEKLIESCVKNISKNVMLSVSCDLTLETESVITKPLSMWKQDKNLKRYHKRPCVFVLGKEPK